MECEALKRVRDDMGLTNVEIMVPFVRTLGQAERVVEHAGRARPEARGRRNGLRVIMMCEVPSNAILAEQFLEHFDGMSIGSNDLTQLTLGLDRDSGLELLAARLRRARPGRQGDDLARHRGLPRAPASTSASAARGRATIPDFADWLADEGIVSISLNPDSVVETWQRLAKRGIGAAAIR